MLLSLLFIAVPFAVIYVRCRCDVFGGARVSAALCFLLSSCAYAHALCKAGMGIC